jgi:hypothetical protein
MDTLRKRETFDIDEESANVIGDELSTSQGPIKKQIHETSLRFRSHRKGMHEGNHLKMMGRISLRWEAPNPHSRLSFPWMKLQITMGDPQESRGVHGN